MFDLPAIVRDFKDRKSLSETYSKVLNNQGTKYFSALGYEGIEFVDCEPHHLIDQHGTRYLDFIASFATCHWGRRHPVIVSAIEQAARLDLPNLLQFGVPALATILADQLVEYLGGDFARVFFTNSGAETTDYAMKMAMNATGRRKLVYFTGDYHGLTLGALAVNGVTKQQKRFFVDGHHIQVPFNDEEQLANAFKEHGSDIAGVIMEPVQARTGLVATEAIIRQMRDLCDRHGAIMVLDEIKTGFGRTGKDFFFQWSGVAPDILLIAKGLSGGVGGVGGLVYTERMHNKVFNEVEQLGLYSSTFRENNIAMTVGLAVMHLIRTESCLENVQAAERMIRDRLDGRRLQSGEAICVRGMGLQLSLTLEGRKRKVVRALIDAVEKDLFYTMCCQRLLTNRKIVTMIPNRFGAAIAVIPALNIPLPAVEKFCDAVADVFDEMSSQSELSMLKSTVKSARQLL
jgi:acetylornithine/succinyldiaminopimelate/putrescine aminotransferase